MLTFEQACSLVKYDKFLSALSHKSRSTLIDILTNKDMFLMMVEAGTSAGDKFRLFPKEHHQLLQKILDEITSEEN